MDNISRIIGVLLAIGCLCTSGCIESTDPKVPMRKIVEYPVVVTLEKDLVIILFEGGETTMKTPDGVTETNHWKLITSETHFYRYKITGFSTIYWLHLGNPDNPIPARDLILKRDGTAKLGCVENDVFFDGDWW